MKRLLLSILVASTAFAQNDLKPLRAGIVGLDTSHVPAFTKLFNKGETEGELAGIKVTTGYTGGTDMPASATRKEKFTQQLRDMGVEIVPTIAELLAKVDVVLLESVDGRIHLQEAREIFKAGKPVFIDKPLAGTLAEIRAALAEAGIAYETAATEPPSIAVPATPWPAVVRALPHAARLQGRSSRMNDVRPV